MALRTASDLLDTAGYGRTLHAGYRSGRDDVPDRSAASPSRAPPGRSIRACDDVRMKLMRPVVVFDAADMAAESAFWAGMLGGRVVTDDTWHSVFDADGRWVIGVQFAPDHVPPDWPEGNPQQVHLDLHGTTQRAPTPRRSRLALACCRARNCRPTPSSPTSGLRGPSRPPVLPRLGAPG